MVGIAFIAVCWAIDANSETVSKACFSFARCGAVYASYAEIGVSVEVLIGRAFSANVLGSAGFASSVAFRTDSLSIQEEFIFTLTADSVSDAVFAVTAGVLVDNFVILQVVCGLDVSNAC